MGKSDSLGSRLRLFFHRRREELPAELQQLIKDKSFGLDDLPSGVKAVIETKFKADTWPRSIGAWERWDTWSEAQRRNWALEYDAQHPTDLAAKQQIEDAFQEGATGVAVLIRNRRNAKQARPSRQVLSDARILRTIHNLMRKGVAPHKQCSTAYKRLTTGAAPRISMRAFRKRWSGLLARAKKGT